MSVLAGGYTAEGQGCEVDMVCVYVYYRKRGAVWCGGVEDRQS